MKFKLFSAVLLLVCFVFLGVLSGVIPVTELPRDAAAGLFPARSSAPAPSPETSPAARTPRAAASPSGPPAVLPSPETAPTKTPFTAVPQTVPPSGSPVPEASAVPSAQPSSTAPPAETAPPAAAAESQAHLWEPAAEVISTTITWNNPLQNDTAYTVDGEALLRQAPDLTLPADGYQILIVHTHGSEAYTPDGDDQYEATGEYRTSDPDHSILRVGQALGNALESYGLHVLVDTGLYDWPDYNSAYARSASAIQDCLSANPGIQVVIDLHRDALGDEATTYRTVSDQIQPDAAQIMLVVGTDTNLPHPNWRANLAFAMSLQGLVEEQYPHLMRPTLLCPYRYNQQMTPGSVLLEIGTAGNTLREAITAAELFAKAVGPALAACVGA